MSKRLQVPLQSNDDNKSVKSSQSDTKKWKNKKEEKTRCYSIDSMADGNRRKNRQNSKDADFFRFPEPKTLLFKATSIGLYSPLVSTRSSRVGMAQSNNTIYSGVPSYLNPNLMRQRVNRSKSVKMYNNNNNNNNNNISRKSSDESEIEEKERKLNESNLSKELNKRKKDREELFVDRGSFSYQELDDTDPNRERLYTEWATECEQVTVSSYVKTAPQKRLLDDFSTIWKRAYFALVLLAMFNGLLTFCISKAASQVWILETWIYEYDKFQIAHGAPAYLLQLILKLILILGSICLTRTFAPGCAGSGVPELRAILSGIWIRHYLSKTTFFIKICALTLSLSSGVPIGLEGPFIHLSSIIGRQLTKLSFFSHLDRKQMLSAACAGGLASVFGAPIGGVLFSIEVTSTYYPVTNYWTAFCCAMVGSTMTHLFQTLSPTSLLLYQTDFNEADIPKPKEFIYFAILGTAAGIMGVGFIYFHDLYVSLRRKYQSRFLGDNPYGIAIVVVVAFTTILFFIGDFAIEPARKAVSDMFNIEYLNNCDNKVFGGVGCGDCQCVEKELIENPLDHDCVDGNIDDLICQQNDWCHCYYHDWIINGGLYANLSSFYILNYLFTICAVTLSYPCGIFSPIFTLGSVFGRIFGEIFRIWFIYCDPRVYSVVGAAAMAAGVTQTISPAVIALEITQDLSLAVPCLIAVIMAGGVSGTLIHSFYDSVLQLRGIPMLPIRPTVAYKRIFMKQAKTRDIDMNHIQDIDIGRPGIDSKPEIILMDNNNNDIDIIKPEAMYRLLIADDVMNKEFSFVTIDPTSNQLINILTNDLDQEWFPIVHTMSEAVLVGEVRRSVLMDLLQKIDINSYQNDLPSELKMNHISFYDQSKTELKDKASLMNDTLLLNETLNNKPKTLTFKYKLSKWRKNSKDEAIEMSENNEDEEDEEDEEDKNNDNDNDKIKITLMSSGFIERINLSPIQVISEMPLTKIYTLFHILKPQNVYVTKYSRLIGVINEVSLLKREFQTQATSKKAKMYCLKCNKLCRDCKNAICCSCCC